MVVSILIWMPCPGAGGASEVPLLVPPSSPPVDGEPWDDEDDAEEHAPRMDKRRSGTRGRMVMVAAGPCDECAALPPAIFT
jgi:hypothetical protein